MKATLLLSLLSLGCAIQAQIVSDAEPYRGEVLTAPLFAPSAAPDALSAQEAAPAEHVNAIRATPMEGPFSSTEDYCEWLFRTSERFNPVANENYCEHSPITIEGGISLRLVSSMSSDLQGAERHIAVETEQGWFVADAQYLDDLSFDGANDIALSRLQLSVEDLLPGGEPEIVLRAARKESRGKRLLAQQEQMIVCAAGEEPGCIALSAPRVEGERASLSVTFSASSLFTRGALLFSSQREVALQGERPIIF